MGRPLTRAHASAARIRRLREFSLLPLLLALACTDGEGGASTSAGSSASASTSASTTAAPSTSETSPGTSTTATGGSASTTRGTTTQASSSTTPPSTSAATSQTTDASATQTGDPATTDGSGSTAPGTSDGTGGDGACVDLGDVDFGRCEAIVGHVFDGEACVLRSGCGCEPHCDAVFASADACALACADAGVCDASKMHAAGIAAEPFVTGSFCDGVYLCGGDEAELAALFPGQPYEAQGAYPCEGASMCTAYYQGEIDAAEWTRLCAASLLPGVTGIHCTIWGP